MAITSKGVARRRSDQLGYPEAVHVGYEDHGGVTTAEDRRARRHPCGKRQASPTTRIIPHHTGDQLPDAEITSPNSFQAVPSNFATRVDKKSLR
jgi:hypothetical protein